MINKKKCFHISILILLFIFLIILVYLNIILFVRQIQFLFVLSIAINSFYLIYFIYYFINFLYDVSVRKNGYEIRGIVVKEFINIEGKIGKHIIWYKYKIDNEYVITKDNLLNIVGKKPRIKEKDRIPLLTNGKKAVIDYKRIKDK